jgi:hypothetical protein
MIVMMHAGVVQVDTSSLEVVTLRSVPIGPSIRCDNPLC